MAASSPRSSLILKRPPGMESRILDFMAEENFHKSQYEAKLQFIRFLIKHFRFCFIWVGVNGGVQVWRSDDNPQKLFFSFRHVGSRSNSGCLHLLSAAVKGMCRHHPERFKLSWMWWHMLVIQALRRKKQADEEGVQDGLWLHKKFRPAWAI